MENDDQVNNYDIPTGLPLVVYSAFFSNERRLFSSFIGDSLALTGYHFDMMGQWTDNDFNSIIIPADANALNNYFTSLLNSHSGSFTFHYRIKTPQGEIRWLLDKGIVTRSEGSLYLQGTLIDITEQIRSQQEFTLRERRFKTMTESISDLLWFIDADLSISYCSPSVSLVLGYTREEFLALSLENLIEPTKLDTFKQVIDLAKNPVNDITQSGRSIDIRLKKIDNSLIWTHNSLSPLLRTDGSLEGFICVTRDIEKQKLSAQLLKQSEQKTSALVKAIPDVYLILNNEGVIQDIKNSNVFFQSLGFSPVGKTYLEVFDEPIAKRFEYILIHIKVTGSTRFLEFEQRLEGKAYSFEARFVKIDEETSLIVMRDITERKWVEKVQDALLRISQAVGNTKNTDELYKTIHQVISYLFTAKNMFIAHYNPTKATFSFPYIVDEAENNIVTDDKTEYSLGGKSCTEYILRNKVPLLLNPADIDRLLNDGEIQLVGPRAVQWMGAPLMDTNDSVIGVIALQTYDDSTTYTLEDLEILTFISTQIAISIQRKDYAEKLAIGKEYFETLISNISDGIVIIDSQGKPLYSNLMAHKITGYQQGDMTNVSAFTLVNPKDMVRILDLFKQITHTEGKWINAEFKVRHAEGHYITVEAHAINLINHSMIKGILINFRDISERKNSEAEIKKLSLVVEKGQLAVVITNPDESVNYVNPRFLEITGYASDEVIGSKQFLHKLQELNPESYSRIIESILHGETWRGEILTQKKSGENYWEYSVITPVQDKTGQLTQVIYINEDLSEIKEKELKLLESEKQLKLRNLEKDRFFSIIAHDLKSPFTPLLGFAQLLYEEIDDLTKEEQVQYAKNIYDTSKSIYRLLENLLEWSRSQIGQFTYNPVSFDLSALIKDIIAVYQPSARSKKIQLSQISEESTTVFADKAMTSTVLRNLISNALKFTPADGIVAVSYYPFEDKIKCSVSDTGVGISEADQEKLFKLDSSFSLPGTDNEKGTGLGLLLCKDLVEKQGGVLTLSSEIGGGSEFTFTLSSESQKSTP